MWDLRVRVWGLRCKGLGFRVWRSDHAPGLKLRVYGLGFGVEGSGLGFRVGVSGLGFRV